MTSATYVEAISSAASRLAKPTRSLAVLITGAAMMQAAVMVASTASTLLFAMAGLLLAGGSAAGLVSAPHLTGAGLLLVLFVLGYGWNLSLVGGSALLVRDVPKTDQLHVQGAVEAAVWGASAFATFTSTQLFAAGGYQLLAAVSVALVAIPLFHIAGTRPTPSTDKETTP